MIPMKPPQSTPIVEEDEHHSADCTKATNAELNPELCSTVTVCDTTDVRNNPGNVRSKNTATSNISYGGGTFSM